MMPTKKKATVQPGENEQEMIARLKKEFLEYFRQVPIQRAAADSIGRDEDTILNWRKADPEFAEAVQKAKSDFAFKNGKSRVDSLLSKLYPEFKPERQQMEVIVPTAINITHVHPTDNDPADTTAG